MKFTKQVSSNVSYVNLLKLLLMISSDFLNLQDRFIQLCSKYALILCLEKGHVLLNVGERYEREGGTGV